MVQRSLFNGLVSFHSSHATLMSCTTVNRYSEFCWFFTWRLSTKLPVCFLYHKPGEENAYYWKYFIIGSVCTVQWYVQRVLRCRLGLQRCDQIARCGRKQMESAQLQLGTVECSSKLWTLIRHCSLTSFLMSWSIWGWLYTWGHYNYYPVLQSQWQVTATANKYTYDLSLSNEYINALGTVERRIKKSKIVHLHLEGREKSHRIRGHALPALTFDGLCCLNGGARAATSVHYVSAQYFYGRVRNAQQPLRFCSFFSFARILLATYHVERLDVRI